MKTGELQLALTSNPYTHRVYGGVFPRDGLPIRLPRKRPLAFIANTHKNNRAGEHWIAFYFHKNGQAFYFDSYGLPPMYPEFLVFLKSNASSFTHNIKRVQGKQRTCGMYCLYFILSMVRGQARKMFKHLTSHRSLTMNDQWIKRWYQNTFQM